MNQLGIFRKTMKVQVKDSFILLISHKELPVILSW